MRKKTKKAMPKRGPFIKTARAKKTPGKTVRVGGTEVLKPKKKGQKVVSFKKGGLHKTLGVAAGKKIPASKMAAALRGEYGTKAKKQALFAKNVLVGK